MVDGVRTFDPVGAFQRGRRGQQLIAAEEAAVPRRNQLAELNIQQAQQTLGAGQATQARQTTTFDQQQRERRATILGQSAAALLGIPEGQRPAAFAALSQTLTDEGIDVTQFAGKPLTNENLQGVITQSQGLVGGQPAVSDLDLARAEKLRAETGQIGVPKRTTLERNLIAAGLTEGSPEFQAAVLASTTKPAVQVGVSVGGDKAEQVELAKLRAQDLKSIRARADQAQEQIASLDILENIDVETGALQPILQPIAAFAEAFGVDATALTNVTAGQAFNSEAKKLVLKVMATQKGPQTDQDRAQIEKTIANLGNTKASNQFIIDSTRAIARRNVEQREFFDNFLGEKDTLKGASAEWNKFKRNVPMVSRFLKTPEGLPIFFFKFSDRLRGLNPGASQDEIIAEWQRREKAAKGAR